MPTIFTDRRGGFSSAPFESLNLALHVGDEPAAVLKNRKSLTHAIGPIQFMNQVHGDSFVIAHSISQIDPTCDALITTIPGLALAVLVADCIPLLLSSPTVVAAVHVGRKGLTNSIALKVANEMRALGADKIHANIGPSICGQCYEVSPEIFEEVLHTHPLAAAQTQKHTPALDLPKALIGDLASEGITYDVQSECTRENPHLFSYRRQKVTGRNAGVIWL